MNKAITDLQGFLENVSYEDYENNFLLQRGIERELEILGEAARRLSTQLRDQHPEISWSKIIGLRNVIAHQYEDVRIERIWEIVQKDIPILKAQLQPLLPQEY
ncbi:HepT-like ribonuclease domain-containing protein [Prochlorothrix hollandica]|uniref:HepT-like ribonuclease domain-containing protein n=1 Tax=Prochlorothrix hollandica TaxID=1223 RepID=UPI00334117D0